MRAPALPRAARTVLLLAGLTAFALGLLACGHGAAPPTPSPSATPQGDVPPAWVQKEVAWQSLAYGDAHPRECLWTVTRPSRLAFLVPYLKSYAARPEGAVYLAVLQGQFQLRGTHGPGATRLYLVLWKRDRFYLAHGLVPGRLAAKQFPRMLSYRPVVPVSTSVWGHAYGEGGPAPGGIYPSRRAQVSVYAGTKAAGAPLTTIRTDADGFFPLDLKPGTYTFIMTGKPYTATTATVRDTGPPLAVAVVLQMF